MSTFDIYKPHKKQILITCKTYPNPSNQYEELVCIAGVTMEREWMRLAPVNFRCLPFDRQFKKYSIVEATIVRHDKDPRPETYRPHPESIRVIGRYDTEKCTWKTRNAILLPLASNSIEELEKRNQEQGCSLGLLKVGSDLEFLVEPDAGEWTAAKRTILERENLLTGKNRPLDKIPWKFKYKFRCDDSSCRGHTMQIFDWEICALYRNLLVKYGDEKSALDRVADKYQNEFSLDKKDLHFFVGTNRTHLRTFMIIGVYYPPKSKPN